MSNENIIRFYERGGEQNRLEGDLFRLEGIRTKEIINRYLTPGLRILDVGGGTGYYAFWLTALGHKVNLIDLTPSNIELAKQYAQKNNLSLEMCKVGDATALDIADEQFDIVLLLGPLYHLTEKPARIRALTEARRVLKKGGVLLAAVISRYAPLIDGLSRNLVDDEDFEQILFNDLQSGIHVNSTDNPEYFTTAFLHRPAEIKEEITESGLQLEKLVAIESVGWISNGLYNEKIKRFIDIVESNDDLMAMSPHIMAVARKPGGLF